MLTVFAGVGLGVVALVGDSVGGESGGGGVGETTDGDSVGDLVGEAIGDSVGDSVSKSVGDSVGESVGDSVGESVGDSVGEGVGNSVGDSVGKSVGDSVGEGVGNSVGDSVGESVGDSVGEGVGDSVGDCVGDGVGSLVGDSVGGAGVGGGVGSFQKLPIPSPNQYTCTLLGLLLSKWNVILCTLSQRAGMPSAAQASRLYVLYFPSASRRGPPVWSILFFLVTLNRPLSILTCKCVPCLDVLVPACLYIVLGVIHAFGGVSK